MNGLKVTQASYSKKVVHSCIDITLASPPVLPLLQNVHIKYFEHQQGRPRQSTGVGAVAVIDISRRRNIKETKTSIYWSNFHRAASAYRWAGPGPLNRHSYGMTAPFAPVGDYFLRKKKKGFGLLLPLKKNQPKRTPSIYF